MKRRAFLKILRGGTIAAAAGVTAFATTRTPRAALAPWGQAGAYADARMRVLSYAVLAPNPHNRQPWIVDLRDDGGFTLFFDTDKQLPHTDPFDRQLTIGLGCFLEMARMAAAAEGYRLDLVLFPEGEDPEGLDTRPIAHARLIADGTQSADPLWAHVMQRRSNKEPFDTTRAVSQADLDSILSVGGAETSLGGSVAEADIAFWRGLSTEALTIEIETPRTYKESVDLFRIGKREVNANPDGIDFSGVTFETLNRLGMFDRTSALDTSSLGYVEGLKAVLANCQTAMGHVWMTTPGNTRRDQIIAGRDWLRANLAATRAGLGFQPLSQALQEYREMDALYRDVHARLAPEGGTVQMLARIGHGITVAESPRWPIEAKVRTA
ncbi:Acg family FMN-binding oxidoreductase [Roseobacteraceae bacterium S113]